MSQHEYEHLVEMSVNTLDQSPQASTLDLRSLFFTLYEFQGMFDTGNTYFRVMPILLKHRLFYRINPKDYPDHALLGAQFKDSKDWLEVIPANPHEEFDVQTNPCVAYWFFERNPSQMFRDSGVVDRWDEPRIFVPAESSLVARLVERGVLPVSEATPPQKWPIEEVAALVVREAEAQGNTDLIGHWFLLLPTGLIWDIQDDEALEVIKANRHVQELRRIAQRTGADQMDFDYGATRRPTLDDFAEFEEEDSLFIGFVTWWFNL